MAILTQDLVFKQQVIKYSLKHGVTLASKLYKTTRQWVYYWLNRYDGTRESLVARSRRPHHHPKEHTQDEIKLIQDMFKRNKKDGLLDFYIKLRLRGYTRAYATLFRVMRRLELFKQKKSKKKRYEPKPYEKMTHPGERVQIDVKFVPRTCLAGSEEKRLYQYTAIDEYSRQRYLEGFGDNTSYSSAVFAKNAVKYFATQGYRVECVQTDNGQEFTKRFLGGDKKTLFEETLARMGIRHKRIRPFTPRHNGKVERSHRKDQARFYNRHSFYSLEDLKEQLSKYNKEYNNFPMIPLHFKSPNQVIYEYFTLGVINV